MGYEWDTGVFGDDKSKKPWPQRAFQFANRVIGSPVGQAGANWLSNRDNYQRSEQFRQEQEGRAAELGGIVGKPGQDIYGRASRDVGRYSRELGRSSEAYWGEGAPQRRFDQYAAPIYGGYDNMVTDAQTSGRLLNRMGRDRARISIDEGSAINTGYATRELQSRQRGQGIVSGYGDRYERGMSNLEGMGEQSRRDIQQQYDSERARQRMELSSRNLGGSTVMSSMMGGVERERRDALGREDERLREQRLYWDAGLSGETLQARQFQQGRANTMSGDVLSSRETQQTNAANMRADAMDTYGYNREYTDLLRQNRLTNRTNMGAEGLNYRDAAFQQQQADKYNYGMMPAQFEMDWEAQWRQLQTQDIQRQPPEQYRPQGY